MSPSSGCLEEHELLILLAGEPDSEPLRAHLLTCAVCVSRLEDLRARLTALRGIGLGSPATGLVSTDADPDTDSVDVVLGSSDLEPDTTTRPTDDLSTTEPWQAGILLWDDSSGAAQDAAEEPPIPPAIGKYLVVGRFARSGQAEVYRVVHPQFHRDLVLKLGHSPFDEQGRSDILAEGRHLAELEHPNIVRVHDLDFHEERPFLVMEYIRGRTLSQYSREERITPRQSAALLRQLAGAVAFAHSRGIVHQDIKPENVLIDEAGRPRLIDFGLASRHDAWTASAVGSEGGTFAYIAPEQARLEPNRVRSLSDVFALGGLLYFLLTGRAPFAAPTQEERWDLARRCEFDRAALAQARVPRHLGRICLKAMAADPDQRYRSAGELERALRRYQRSPVLAAAGMLLTVAVLGVYLCQTLIRPAISLPTDAPTSLAVPAPATLQLAAPAQHLSGELILRIWMKGAHGKRGLRVDEPGALPVRTGELVHLEVLVNQPAYLYLLWLDGKGNVDRLYPWSRDSQSPMEAILPLTHLDFPTEVDRGLPLQGPSGLETAILLARRSPLPGSTDLVKLIGAMPPAPLGDPLELAVLGFDPVRTTGKIDRRRHRGLGQSTERIDEPLLQLGERLRPHFELIRAVQFAYQSN
jgi:serine/threonine protein kinase